MIDPVLVTRKINLIGEDLRGLASYAELTLEAYLADRIHEIVVERCLERMIARMIDINYHLATELGHAPPKDYFESFTVLGKLKVLPEDFSRAIAQTAGLRNRLVHEYNELDERKVYAALKQAVNDIPHYLACINRFIAGE